MEVTQAVGPAATDGALLSLPVTDRGAHALDVARKRFEAKPDWVTFHREVLGVDGVVWRLFPLQHEYDVFRGGDDYAELLLMLGRLVPLARRGEGKRTDPLEVITVRIP